MRIIYNNIYAYIKKQIRITQSSTNAAAHCDYRRRNRWLGTCYSTLFTLQGHFDWYSCLFLFVLFEKNETFQSPIELSASCYNPAEFKHSRHSDSLVTTTIHTNSNELYMIRLCARDRWHNNERICHLLQRTTSQNGIPQRTNRHNLLKE